MICRLLVAVLLLTEIACANDDPANDSQQPITLKASSSRVLPLPFFTAALGPQCDSSGNLYFDTGYSSKRVVLKVTTSDGSATVYRPSDASAAGTYFIAYYVTPGRKIAILVGGQKKDEPIVYQFSESDPVNSTRTALDAPDGLKGLTVQSFLVLPNDHILLQGYFDKDAPKEKQGRGYLAEFDSSGKMLRISLEKANDDVLKLLSNRGAKTAAAQSEDGTIYLLEADKIVVFSPSGDAVRKMKLTPPEAGYTPEVLYMHKGQMIVGFIHHAVSGKDGARMRFELLNPATGELIRDYQSDPELGQNLVCFSDEGLIFLLPEKGHVKLISADLK